MAKKGLSDNAKLVFAAVKKAYDDGVMLTAAEIADITGISIRSVNPIITMCFCAPRKDPAIMQRIEIEGEKAKKIKLLEPDFDVNAVPEEE